MRKFERKKWSTRYSYSTKFLFESYDYLFYRTYLWQLDQWKLKGLAADIAGSDVGLLVGLNLITAVNVMNILTGWRWLRFWEVSEISAVVVGLAWVGGFSRFYKYRVDIVISKFGDESIDTKKKRTRNIWIYNILTFATFFATAIWAALASQ